MEALPERGAQRRLYVGLLSLVTGLYIGDVSAQPTSRYAFTGVGVVSMDTNSVAANQTVVVSAGLIDAIGSSAEIEIPENAIVIKSDGRYLMPGLTEMHGHVPGADDQQFLEDVLFLYVANGVTTVRGMQGQTGHLELREKIAEHSILGPRFITSGPGLRGNAIDGPEDARRIVFEQADDGYDFIKLLRGLTRAEYDAAVAAGAEAGIELAGHVSADVGVGRALEAGQATIDHLDGYLEYLVPPEVNLADHPSGFYGINLLDLVDEQQITQAAIATREAGVWIVPTQALVEHIATASPTAAERAALPEMAYMPPDLVREWTESKQRIRGTLETIPDGPERLQALRRQIIKTMHDEGVRLLLGSDAPQIFSVPGFSLHQELALIVEAGLTPYEALHSGTVAPAEFFDLADQFGRLQPGLAADFVLLEENPLEQVTAASHPQGVMLAGRWLDRARLDEGLAAIAARHNR